MMVLIIDFYPTWVSLVTWSYWVKNISLDELPNMNDLTLICVNHRITLSLAYHLPTFCYLLLPLMLKCSLSLSPSLPIYPFTYFWSIFVIDEGNMHFMLQVVGKWRRLLIAYNFTWFFTKRIQVRISKTNNIDFLQSCKSF